MKAMHRLLCRVGAHHWTYETDPETRKQFHKCSRCGKEGDTLSVVAFPLGCG